MTERDRRVALVGVLLFSALAALSVGIPATISPHGFYRGYPYVSHWVDLLPPYNQHLTADVGEFELAFGLLFLWAARRPHRALVVPLCLAWAFSQTLHAAYHVVHLDNFSTGDAAAQTAAFVVLILASLAGMYLSHRGGDSLKGGEKSQP